MAPNNDIMIERIKSDPDFQELVSKRSRLGWILSVIMLLIYFGFIATIAFDKELLARPIGDGSVMTVGIPVGLGVILSAFVLTAIYVARANSSYDDLTRRIIEKVKK